MKLDVFISGEQIDLCIPTEEFARDSDWYTWLNNKQITRFLYHGAMPNTANTQLDFFKKENSSRLLLIIFFLRFRLIRVVGEGITLVLQFFDRFL